MSLSNVINILEQIQSVLEQCSSKKWTTIIKTHAERLKAATDSNSVKWIKDELEAVKELYGGMGSFSDVYITPEAGYNIKHEDVSSVNNMFKGLQSQLYDETESELRRLNRNNPT
jgi:hypothetical protein